MKLLSLISLVAAALVLSAASSPAGAAGTPGWSASHGLLGLVPHVTHTSRLAATGDANRTAAGLNCVSSCSSYVTTINQFFTDIAAESGLTTNVYSVLPQYSDLTHTIAYSTSFPGQVVDTNAFPSTNTCQDGFDKYCVTNKQLQTEIANVIAANHWPTTSTTTLYFIFTPANVGVCEHPGKVSNLSNACTTNAFCAYHSASSSFLYAVEPDNAAVYQDACNTGQAPAGNDADSTISTISHEQIEAITDPFGNGWWSEDPEQSNRFFGSEIGDLCAWNFGADVGTTVGGQSYNQVINTHDYYLQQEWSNSDGGCVQHVGGPVSNFDSGNVLYAGTGPLVDHAGPLMESTAIYAIYWIPAAPVNSRPPTIAGQEKVGRTLRAFHGAWSNSPAFTYRWLRCSAAGTSCKAIRKATDSSYRLDPADAGHRLEVRVTATTQGGHASATSTPTTKVRS